MGRFCFTGCFAFLLVVIGFSPNAMSAGELDETFGHDGKTITDFFGKTDVLRNLLIDADGKILVSGSATKTSISDHFALARYDNDGHLDATFGKEGKVIANKIAGNKVIEDGIEGFGLQEDGKIVTCVRWHHGQSSGIGLQRYRSNGSLDESFGDGGSVLTPDVSENHFPLALAIDSNDRIVIVAAAFKKGTLDSLFAVFRYKADGRIDESFGIEGRTTTKKSLTEPMCLVP